MRHGKCSVVFRDIAGFTLIELLAVITIVGVMLFITVPSFEQWVEGYRFRQDAGAVVNAVRLAKSEAVRRNQQVVFQCIPGTGETAGFRVAVDANNNEAIDAGEALLVNSVLSGQTKLEITSGFATNVGGFTPRGMPAGGITGSFKLSAKGREVKITQNFVGGIRIE